MTINTVDYITLLNVYIKNKVKRQLTNLISGLDGVSAI